VLGSRDSAESPACQAIHAALAVWLADCKHAWNKRGFPACWEKLTRSAPAISKRKKPKDLTTGVKISDESPVLISLQESLAQARFKSRLLVDLTHIGELLALRQSEHKLDPEQLLNYLSLRVGGEEDATSDVDSDASSDEALRPESAQSRVIVQTIHKSKGLEYDVVMLMNKLPDSPDKPGTVLKGVGKAKAQLYVESDEHKALFSAQEREESARLLYVAITRAKKRLVVMCPPEPPSNGKVPTYHGFYKVLHSVGVNPYDWRPVTQAAAAEGAALRQR
jgi:ATP-dependent exoDNAse (exonuclease V) beta subunit